MRENFKSGSVREGASPMGMLSLYSTMPPKSGETVLPGWPKRGFFAGLLPGGCVPSKNYWVRVAVIVVLSALFLKKI
jgi:hypothetical protein